LRSHFLVFLCINALLTAQNTKQGAPLPDPRELKQRAEASMRKSERDLENYSCIVRVQEFDLNADGYVKHQHQRVEERFYVNGMEINHAESRDGKPLTGGDAKKEQERVDKEVKKYSDRTKVEKEQAEDDKQADTFLRALSFYNGRREKRDNRSVVVYDLAGDPSFHPHRIEERFAQALTGRVWLDEESGTPWELQVETVRDVKIGGGLLANVHKGFRAHFIQQRQPDGVWLTKMVEGSGDMKAALFLHPRFRFREDLEQCHLFSVTTQEKIDTQQKVQAPKP
jgi:hypothetical protein